MRPARRVKAAACRAWRRLGHRGLFLVLLGVYDLFFGLYLIRGGALIAPTLLPEDAWGWAWITTGTLLIAGGTRDRDGWAFALAVFVKTAWALESFRLQFQHHPDQWIRGCYFLALALVVLAVSSWPEDVR